MKRRYMKLAILLLTVVLTGMVWVAQAGDAEGGKDKAAVCAGCHGINGISSNEIWPNLAGQQAAYLVVKIKAYRDGTLQDPLMSPISQGLSDTDIENLAAYYSELKQPCE
ncbi:MAG: cytochrome c [Candidatus Competibacteraceae bacterium]|nr:cytochrome c [Candidatus Competibacteraceae bacterium]